ncbi:MAG: STAS domain-containing protein [Mycobacteriales bacterium]
MSAETITPPVAPTPAPPGSLTIDLTRTGARADLHLCGRLGQQGSQQIDDLIDCLVLAGAGQVAVDVDGLSTVDAAVLAFLRGRQRRCAALGLAFTVTSTRARTRRLVDMVGLRAEP